MRPAKERQPEVYALVLARLLSACACETERRLGSYIDAHAFYVRSVLCRLAVAHDSDRRNFSWTRINGRWHRINFYEPVRGYGLWADTFEFVPAFSFERDKSSLREILTIRASIPSADIRQAGATIYIYIYIYIYN